MGTKNLQLLTGGRSDSATKVSLPGGGKKLGGMWASADGNSEIVFVLPLIQRPNYNSTDVQAGRGVGHSLGNNERGALARVKMETESSRDHRPSMSSRVGWRSSGQEPTNEMSSAYAVALM